MSNYIFITAGWYPNKFDLHIGDFVQRHAIAMALHQPVIVLHIVKSNRVKSIERQITTTGQLIEHIIYYPEAKIGGKILGQFWYNKLFKESIKDIFMEHGRPVFTLAYIAWKAGLIALYLKRKFSIPYIITDHSSAYDKSDPYYVKHYPIRFKLLKRIFQNAAGCIALSHIYYKNISTLFGINMPYAVIENCVDTKHFFYESKENEPKQFIHVSTMDYPKNVEGLLNAVAKVAAIRTDFKLKLVGPINESLVQLIDELYLAALVECTGLIPYKKVADHLRSADALLMFSRFEGLPCVILEGFCCGLPCISTNVGGIPEIIDDKNGVMIANGDVIALAAEIEAYLNNTTKYDPISIAKKSTELYSYSAIGKRFIDAFQLLLKKA